MSFWSTFSNAASGFLSKIPVVGAPLAGVASAISSELQRQDSKKDQKELAKYTSDLSMQNWTNQFQQQTARQDELLATQKSSEVNAMQNAGLNPSSLAGGASNVVTPSGGSSSLSTGSPYDTFAAFMNAKNVDNQSKLADAEANLKNEEAKKLRRENKLNESYDSLLQVLGNVEGVYYDANGNLTTDASQAESVAVIPYNEGSQRALNSYLTSKSYNARQMADYAAALLDEMVSKGRTLDNEVLNSLIKLPDSQRKQILQATAESLAGKHLKESQKDLTIAQKDLAETEKKIKENNNVFELVDKSIHADSWTDKIQALLTLVILGFTRAN